MEVVPELNWMLTISWLESGVEGIGRWGMRGGADGEVCEGGRGAEGVRVDSTGGVVDEDDVTEGRDGSD
jgi:hypothetical protein